MVPSDLALLCTVCNIVGSAGQAGRPRSSERSWRRGSVVQLGGGGQSPASFLQKPSGANGVVTVFTEVLLAARPTWPSLFRPQHLTSSVPAETTAQV